MFGIGQLPEYAERFVHAVVETRLRPICHALRNAADPSTADLSLLEAVLANLGCGHDLIDRLIGPPPPPASALVLRLPRPRRPPDAAEAEPGRGEPETGPSPGPSPIA